MDAALNGLANSVKHQPTKEAVAQAKEALKNFSQKGDVPIAYVREKCLAAAELAFDNANEKSMHFAVEIVQALLRDSRFHSSAIENPQHNLPTQVLSTMTGITQWSTQLQRQALTLLVEMICSNELRASLQEFEETLELYIRVFGSSKEESVRISARASISQSISSYFENRYSAEEAQDNIAVYLDVTKLLDAFIAKLDGLSIANEHAIAYLEAVNSLLAAQPAHINSHTPFVNILWEKLCPLVIRMLGVPDKSPSVTATVQMSVDEPVGQGQASQFALSPAVISNPEGTRALYQVVEQLIRLMCPISSVNSMLEALLHKAFLFPKIEQRSEAVRVIKKILSDKLRIADLVTSCVRAGSLNLWRMFIVCLTECANPQCEIAIDAIRAVSAMLQGILDFSNSSNLLPEETEQWLRERFPELSDATAKGFTIRSDINECSPRVSKSRTETREESICSEVNEEKEDDDEMKRTLDKISSKFGMGGGMKEIREENGRRTTDEEENSSDSPSDTITAKQFVELLSEKMDTWKKMKSTLNVDEAILEFASSFYSEFSAAHSEVFKSEPKIQDNFLNTDALYLTAYAALSLALRGSSCVTWAKFRDSVLSSGCTVYASENWLKKVYDQTQQCNALSEQLTGKSPLTNVVRDYDGIDKRILTDVARLQSISRGFSEAKSVEEQLAARWLITSAWDCVVQIVSVFIGIKDRGRARDKVLEGVEHTIGAMHLLLRVALQLELGKRCGWIFENLVETSCSVEELRIWTSWARKDFLSIQLMLDNALVAVHAPECWKHLIRCSEYVWELEKHIYGSLCYEKPSRFAFLTKKKEEKQEDKVEEGVPPAERCVERVLGDGTLTQDHINKALCILIAKIDRFYTTCSRQLSLQSLKELCLYLVSASENRIFYCEQSQQPSLAPAVNILSRISETISNLPNRPLVHQMIVWPIVSKHFVLVSLAPTPDVSRCGVTALAESASSLLLAESPGLCFNQSLIAPFQSIVCSEVCTSETREQLLGALSDFVRTKSDRIGSGYKPLFGTMRAVRTCLDEDSTAHWTVLDLITTYLGINKCSILSWSFADCLQCIMHFLQKSGSCPASDPSKSDPSSSASLDDQLSSAALRLIPAVYAVLMTLYRTPHLPNPNLLHRYELRCSNIEEVESFVCDESIPPLSSVIDFNLFAYDVNQQNPQDLDVPLDVPRIAVPWNDKSPHEIASVELLLSLVEQLSGTLVTAPNSVQPPILASIHQLLTQITESELGAETTAFCISSLVLPYIQKWLRRLKYEDDTRNVKQAIGTCTEIVMQYIDQHKESESSTRLLFDMGRLAVECTGKSQEGISRVGAACLKHLFSNASDFSPAQWLVASRIIWMSCCVTLHPIRLLSSYFLPNCDDESGDVGTVCISTTAMPPIQQRIVAQQVFQIDCQKDDSYFMRDVDESESAELILTKDGHKIRYLSKQLFSLTNIFIFSVRFEEILSLLASHYLILQLIGTLLITEVTPKMKQVLADSRPLEVADKMDQSIRSSLCICLDASFQVAHDVHSRYGLLKLFSRLTQLKYANLYKQLVSSAAIKFQHLYEQATEHKL
ncbi:hypothetical protein WR25_18060 isoform L [Diploscapter pachys]|nr:hypothetical protein WR25_18060 isoform E [Diploscapter pachys]PAV60026.1 hypothetical protein WR25_18060 isoform L [Diploscapter pachys]